MPSRTVTHALGVAAAIAVLSSAPAFAQKSKDNLRAVAVEPISTLDDTFNALPLLRQINEAIYEQLANTTQRWRDLVGFYTRFGNVNALLAGVDDRYVIMNAGDELRLRFEAQAPPPAGWRRDFVLIGDGWEKDGDFNTGYSDTVLPLPSHQTPDYGAGVSRLELSADPVYQRHRHDWEEFHTRFVSPQTFVTGLRRH